MAGRFAVLVFEGRGSSKKKGAYERGRLSDFCSRAEYPYPPTGALQSAGGFAFRDGELN